MIIFINIHRQSNWRALITIHLFLKLQQIKFRVHESWCERKLRKIIRASQQCWKIHDTWHEMLRMHMFIFRQNIKHYLYSFVEWYVRVIVIDIITSCHFWLNDYLFWSERHDVTKIYFLMILFGNIPLSWNSLKNQKCLNYKYSSI